MKRNCNECGTGRIITIRDICAAEEYAVCSDCRQNLNMDRIKTNWENLLDGIGPLLDVQLKYADRLELDSITISKARAVELLQLVRDIKNETAHTR